MRHLFATVLTATSLAVSVPPERARAQASDDALVGIWSYGIEADPALHGALTLTHRDGAWRVAVGGRQASGKATSAGELRVTFPDGAGELRAHVAATGREIDGFWVQSAKAAAGPSQAYATPVTLRPVGADAWRGQVQPLPRSFTLYLKVFRDPDGALAAAFRNPEFNANAGRGQFLVSRSGERVTFTSRPAPGRQPLVLNAALADGHLRLAYPLLDGPVDLTRRTPAEVAAFYPRPPGAPAYAYHAPTQLRDGWTTAPARRVGLDEAALSRLVQALAESDPAVARATLIHSLLIARHGKLVLEEYFFGFSRETLHDTRSAAKTFNAVMLGSVMMRDPGFGPQNRLYEIMAAHGPFAHPDPRKARITLAHLMTHTSGLDCDDNSDTSPGAEDTMQSQTAQPDWWKYTLDLPMAHDPGARYAYCSGNANLVGGVLAVRTGTWLPELFDRAVARPLRFGAYAWNLTPTGEGYGGGGVYVRSRDLLKIGQAYLDGGVWQGRRIAPAAWVTLSTTPHVEVSPQTTGLSPDDFANVYIRAQDGYAWHINRLRVGARVFQDYEATGNGGQLLIVVPQADVAVVITAGNYGQGGIWNRWRDEIVAGRILAAIR